MIKATTAPQLSPGTVIDGTYTLGAVVRTRGSSATYDATDLGGDRVEVTVYAPECFVSPVALERSLRELRQLEKVASPQIVRVIDTGKLPQGGIYEVHERLSGTPLSDLGALPSAEVVQIVNEVAAALAVAQKAGVIHRNLGADSILRVGRDIKLFNFTVGDPQGGVSFGSIDSIAPEQVEGKNIDERTLVYNLASLTFRLLRGLPLFLAEDTGTTLLQHAASLPEESSMPPQLFAALAKDPKARPALSKFLGDLGVIVRDFPREQVRERPDTLDVLMADPDVPKPAQPAPAAAPTLTPAPIAAPPPAAAPAKSIAPSIVAKPMITPPPAVGPKTAPPPSITPPPAVGAKPAAPASAPFAPPSFSPPAVTPPTLGAPSVSAPSVAAPSVAAPSASSGAPAAKPRTRGWTMFMEATDDEVTPGAGPGVPVMGAPAPTPVAPAPTSVAPTPAVAAAPTPTPAPAPAPGVPGEVKPSTRGWTMIMDEPSEADAAGLALTSPAAATTPPPASPTTRGWTMLEELNDGLPAATPAATPEPQPAAKAEAGGAPTSRGWTMFMEAELQGKEEGGQPSEAEPDPEFYDGQVTTESGTVVAFAPSAESPNARRAEPELGSDGEELGSFRSRFGRGEPEAPSTPASTEPSAPSSPDMPSFTGNSSFDFGGLTPPQPQVQAQVPAAEPAAATRREPVEVAAANSTASALDDEPAPSGGSAKYVVIGLVVVAVVVAIVMFAT